MVKEGYWYGLPLALAAAGCDYLGLYWAAILFGALTLLVLNFFRDPNRLIPSDPGLIVSPADGRVVQIVEETFEGRRVRRISIFMSPLDVHVNRSPIAGTVGHVRYHRGSFRVASQPRASAENEHNIFTVVGGCDADGGRDIVVVKQIAGILARRIVFWKHEGDRLERGERVGLIKFGSRVDVMLHPSAEVRVNLGDRVKAGSSILGVSHSA